MLLDNEQRRVKFVSENGYIREPLKEFKVTLSAFGTALCFHVVSYSFTLKYAENHVIDFTNTASTHI